MQEIDQSAFDRKTLADVAPLSPVLAFEQLMQESDSRTAAAEILEPLDEWCAFCENKLATAKTADGIAACTECAGEVLAAMEKYSQEAAEVAGLHFGPSRADRRRARRKTRLRNNGLAHEVIRTGSRFR